MIFITYCLEYICGAILLKRRKKQSQRGDIIEFNGERYRFIKRTDDYEMWQWLKTYCYAVFVRNCWK